MHDMTFIVISLTRLLPWIRKLLGSNFGSLTVHFLKKSLGYVQHDMRLHKRFLPLHHTAKKVPAKFKHVSCYEEDEMSSLFN